MEKIVNILEYTVHLFQQENFQQYLQEVCEKEQMQTMLFLSVPVMEQVMEDPEYRQQIAKFQMILPGDENIVLVQSSEGWKKQDVMKEEQYMDCLLQYLETSGHSMYLVGDRLEKLSVFLHYCKEKYPKLQIVGTFVGGDQMDDESLLNDINATSPDIILTAIAPQLQERWILKYKEQLTGCACIGADVLVRKTNFRYEEELEKQEHSVLFRAFVSARNYLVRQVRRKMFRMNYESYIKQTEREVV